MITFMYEILKEKKTKYFKEDVYCWAEMNYTSIIISKAVNFNQNSASLHSH